MPIPTPKSIKGEAINMQTTPSNSQYKSNKRKIASPIIKPKKARDFRVLSPKVKPNIMGKKIKKANPRSATSECINQNPKNRKMTENTNGNKILLDIKLTG